MSNLWAFFPRDLPSVLLFACINFADRCLKAHPVATVINEVQKGISVLALSFSRYVCLWQTRYVPFGNSIFARKAGNRYEWPCSLFFPYVLSRHIGAKMKAEALNPAIRIG